MAVKVLVGSANPVKIGAVRDVFEAFFPGATVEGIEVPSGVPGQPVGDQTFVGAEKRALELVRINAERGLGASFCVGLEGGVVRHHGRWFAFGVVCIAGAAGRLGFGVTSHFELPDDVTNGLAGGAELGEVIDDLTGLQDTRLSGGAIGFLSQGRLDRRGLTAQGVFMALLPFFNQGLFFASRPVEADRRKPCASS